jgi:hypothetical protein
VPADAPLCPAAPAGQPHGRRDTPWTHPRGDAVTDSPPSPAFPEGHTQRELEALGRARAVSLGMSPRKRWAWAWTPEPIEAGPERFKLQVFSHDPSPNAPTGDGGVTGAEWPAEYVGHRLEIFGPFHLIGPRKLSPPGYYLRTILNPDWHYLIFLREIRIHLPDGRYGVLLREGTIESPNWGSTASLSASPTRNGKLLANSFDCSTDCHPAVSAGGGSATARDVSGREMSTSTGTAPGRSTPTSTPNSPNSQPSKTSPTSRASAMTQSDDDSVSPRSIFPGHHTNTLNFGTRTGDQTTSELLRLLR